MPTNPAHLATGSALAGVVWGLWRSRAASRARSPDEPAPRPHEDGPAS